MHEATLPSVEDKQHQVEDVDVIISLNHAQIRHKLYSLYITGSSYHHTRFVLKRI